MLTDEPVGPEDRIPERTLLPLSAIKFIGTLGYGIIITDPAFQLVGAQKGRKSVSAPPAEASRAD